MIVNLPGWEGQPAWKPGGLELRFTGDWRAYDFAADLYAVRADGSGFRELLVARPGDDLFDQSAWSPDGARIAFVTCRYN